MRHALVSWILGATFLVACGDDSATTADTASDTVAATTAETSTDATNATETSVDPTGDATTATTTTTAVTEQPDTSDTTVATDTATTDTADTDTDPTDTVDPQVEEHFSNVNAFVRVLNGGDLPVTVSFNGAPALPEFSDIQASDLSTGAWRGFTEVAAPTITVKVVGMIGNYDPGLGNTPETIEQTFNVQGNKRYVVITDVHNLAPTRTNPGGSWGPMFHWNVGLFMEADPTTDGTVPVTLVSTSNNFTQATFKVGTTALGTVDPVASNSYPAGRSVLASVAATGTKIQIHVTGADDGGPEFGLPDLIPNRPAILIDRDGTLGVATLGGHVRYLHPLARVRVLNLLTMQAAPGGSLWLVPDDGSLVPTGIAPTQVAANVLALAQSAFVTVESGTYLPWRWFATSTVTAATVTTTTPLSASTFNEIVPSADQTAIIANVGTGREAAGLPASGVLAFINPPFSGGGDPFPGDATHANIELQSALYDSISVTCKNGDGASVGGNGIAVLGSGQVWATAAQLVGFHCEVTVGATVSTYTFAPEVAHGYRLYLSDAAPTGKGQPFAVLLMPDGTLTKLMPSE